MIVAARWCCGGGDGGTCAIDVVSVSDSARDGIDEVSVSDSARGGGGGSYTSVVVLDAAVQVAEVVDEVVVPLQLIHQVLELVHSPSSAGKKVWYCVVEPFMVR